MATESKPEGQYYAVRLLHAVFAISSIVLLVVVIWMVVDDHYRPWKVHQRGFRVIAREAGNKKLQSVSGERDAEIRTLKERKEAAARALGEREKTVEQLEKGLAKLTAEADAAEVAHHEKRGKDAERLDRKTAKLVPQVTDSSERVKVAEARIGEQRGKLRDLTGDLVEAESALRAARREISVLEARLSTLRDGTVTALRNAAMLDFADPTVRIRKVVVEDLYDDYSFARAPKIDRCITCHLGIDKAVTDPDTHKAVAGEYDRAEQPFTSHPRLDLFVAESSPHPMGRFGCTICHGGAGNETDFALAAHTPRDEQQARQWAEKHGWSRRHHWDHPMIGLENIEARCAQCHDGTFAVPGAEKLSLGRKLYTDFNCFNCHQTKGFESFSPYGPRLTFLADKLRRDEAGRVDRQWLYNWIKGPRTFRPTTRMPHFFFLSNTSSKNDNGVNYLERNKVEILAIAHYLVARSKSNDLASSFDFDSLRKLGDVEKGKELVESIGCLGCHHIGPRRQNAKPQADFGPHLANLGAKTTFEWLFAWLKAPRRHWPEARMPDFRLTDEAAARMASYLVSLRDEIYKPEPVPEVDGSILDEIVIHYLGATLPATRATEKTSVMSGEEKLSYAGEKLMMPQYNFSDAEREALVTFMMGLTAEIVPPHRKRVFGGRDGDVEAGRELVRRKNCLGCHSIERTGPRRESEPPDIAPDLSIEGTRVRHDWLHEFVQRPRTLRPRGTARMPTLYLTASDAHVFARYLAHVSDSFYPFLGRTEIEATREEKLEGESLFELSNCQSCHMVGDRKYRTPTKEFYKKEQMAEIVKLAPDLRFAAGRLRPKWAERWIRNPQAVLAHTKMPNLKLLDRDIKKIVRFIFTEHLDQAEWREWVAKEAKQQEEQPKEYNEFE